MIRKVFSSLVHSLALAAVFSAGACGEPIGERFGKTQAAKESSGVAKAQTAADHDVVLDTGRLEEVNPQGVRR